MLDLTRRSDKTDTAKRREKAEKYLQKGKPGAALEEYLAILREEPGNDAVRQAAANLHLSLNNPKEAAKLLGELFQRQADLGDTTSAIHTYRKLARASKPASEHSLRYAQFIEHTNKKEALEAYELALTGLTAQRNSKLALAAMERIVLLDPSGQNFWRAGELAAQLGDGKRASVYFMNVGELEEKSGGNGGPWYQRASLCDPSNANAALAYGRTLLLQGNFAESLQVLQVLMENRQTATSEARDLYSRALLAAGRLVDAEPILWELFEQNPNRLPQMVELIAALVDSQQDRSAITLSRKLEQQQRLKGSRRDFVLTMSQMVEKHRPSVEMLEYLAELFNGSNRESDYCRTLLKLFDLYFSAGNYQKAGDCLDRAAEVDPYEAGHHSRLEMLRGRIDERRLNAIAERFTIAKKAAEQQPVEGPPDEQTMLQDLMLQAEILVQYGMRSKALERLQRIQQLFPGEEDRNEELRRLYMSAGLIQKAAEAPPSIAIAAAAGAASVGGGAGLVTSPPPSTAFQSSDAVASATAPVKQTGELSDLERVTEIARKLYQETNVKGVLAAALSEISVNWNAARCLGALRTPGKPPSLVLEYTAPEVPATELPARVKLLAALHDMAIERGVLVIPEPTKEPGLSSLREELAAIGGGSLLVLPLSEAQEHMGILVLQAQANVGWRSGDVIVLRSLSDQLVLALHNARLRRLVRNLSVTDEKSGLLKRSSYLDLLLSEVRRAAQQNSCTTVMLIEFGKSSNLVKEFGHHAVETTMREMGQLVSSHIRQADVGVQYDFTTIALILADTSEAGAALALEKLRRIVKDVRLPGRDTPLSMTAGIAEAVLRPNFDPIDMVTEVINRVEVALESAHSADNKICTLPCEFDTAAVA